MFRLQHVFHAPPQPAQHCQVCDGDVPSAEWISGGHAGEQCGAEHGGAIAWQRRGSSATPALKPALRQVLPVEHRRRRGRSAIARVKFERRACETTPPRRTGCVYTRRVNRVTPDQGRRRHRVARERHSQSQGSYEGV